MAPARKQFPAWAGALAFCAATSAGAQEFPARPVRLVVGFATGGSVDLVARLLAQKMSERWGQQVVVDNRPGAGGNVSAEIVARAPADGYTLYLCGASLVVNKSLYSSVPYDPVKDFAPISLVANVQNVLVANPRFPAKSVRELVALAKERPGQINYASTGSGTSGHLTMELFKSMTGIDLVHVPYKIIGQAQNDLISGQVSLWFPTAPGALPHIQAGRMRALAVAGARRSSALPDTPTVAEAGVPDFEASTWYALLAPAGTPRETVNRANAVTVRILGQPEFRDRLAAMGVEAVGGSTEQLAAHIRSELPKWARVVKQSGARVD